MIQFLITLIHYPSLFVTIMFRNSIQDGTKILLSMSRIPSDDVVESLYKLRIRESDQLTTVLELYDMEIHQKISMPDNQKLKTMVKRSIDQKPLLRNFDARHGRIETGAVVKNRKGLSSGERGRGICYPWNKKDSVRRKTNVVSGMRVTIVQSRHRKPHHPLSYQLRKTLE